MSINSHSNIIQDEGKSLSPPDIVRVPVLVDDDLGGADGDGTRLIVGFEIVFSQVDSVGATAAWPHKRQKQGLDLL